MSDSKISGLGAAGGLTGLEILPVVQSGATLRTTVGDLVARAGVADLGTNPGYEFVSANNVTLADSNRTFVNTAATTGYRGGRSGIGRNSGKWYFEVQIVSGTNLQGFGVVTAAYTSFTIAIGQNANTWGWVNAAPDAFWSNNVQGTSAAFAMTAGAVIGIAVDLDNGRLWASGNGTWLLGDPATGTTPGATGFSGVVYPASSSYATNPNSTSHTIRLLSSEFTYSPPSGFAAWGTDLRFLGAATSATTATTATTADKLSDWTIKTANYTAQAGDRIGADTTGGAWTLTLPATPGAGDFIELFDAGGNFGVNSLLVARNGGTIMSLTEDMTVSTSNASFALVHNGTTWRLA